MSVFELSAHLIKRGISEAVNFSIFVIFVFRTGIVCIARDNKGLLREKIPLRGYLVMGIFFFFLVEFLVLSNYAGLFVKGFQSSFLSSDVINMSPYLALFYLHVLHRWTVAWILVPEVFQITIFSGVDFDERTYQKIHSCRLNVGVGDCYDQHFDLVHVVHGIDRMGDIRKLPPVFPLRI